MATSVNVTDTKGRLISYFKRLCGCGFQRHWIASGSRYFLWVLVDTDVERMATEVRSLITNLYQDYMNWANENYRLQGAYFESDPLLKQEIEICGTLSGN